MTDKINISYKASNTGRKFHQSPAFVRGIMGPIGSGKSVACCFEIYIKAMKQEAGNDGVRRSRWIIVRNTLPELETTTMKTWDDWFPQHIFGKRTKRPPYTQTLKWADVELEVIFIAMDRPEEAKKLLSLECTGIWFNEAREIEKAIIDAGTGRVGRYPSAKDGAGATWKGIIMDTNPPADSHWWYRLAEEDTPSNWEFFRQPSGMSPEAENLEYLNQDKHSMKLSIPERREIGRQYYINMLGGKTKEWIDVYVGGEYGFIADGKPVYGSSFNDNTHTAKEVIKANPHAPLVGGVDCSGRSPSAVLAQRGGFGQWQILWEFCAEDMGAVQFSKLLASEIKRNFPHNEISWYGDPAGTWKSQTDERTYVEIMRDAGIRVMPAPTTNRLGERTQAVESVLLRMTGGQPAFLLSPACKLLRRGFNGGYKFKRLSVSGEARHASEPEKNMFSHPHDALQYLLLGGGEGGKMKGRGKGTGSFVEAKMEFDL